MPLTLIDLLGRAGKREKITITNDKGRLSQEEIERMVQEAEEFAEQDKAVKAKVDARNALETYCYNMKQTIEDKLGDKLDEDDKEKVSGTQSKIPNVLRLLVLERGTHLLAAMVHCHGTANGRQPIASRHCDSCYICVCGVLVLAIHLHLPHVFFTSLQW